MNRDVAPGRRTSGQRTTVTIDGLEIEVRFKRMKTVRLHIVPPDGRVWVSAPAGTAHRDIERIVVTRLPFIRETQARMRTQARSAPADPLERGWHQLLGRRLPIVIDPDPGATAGVRLVDDRLMVAGKARRDAAVLQASLDNIQREELERTLADLMPVWEERLGRRASWWGVRAMRTRWGSCSHRSGRIRFSLNLGAQHPRQIEYVVLHELAHLFIPNHGPDFVALMDRHMPDWRARRRALNGDRDSEPD